MAKKVLSLTVHVTDLSHSVVPPVMFQSWVLVCKRQSGGLQQQQLEPCREMEYVWEAFWQSPPQQHTGCSAALWDSTHTQESQVHIYQIHTYQILPGTPHPHPTEHHIAAKAGTPSLSALNFHSCYQT